MENDSDSRKKKHAMLVWTSGKIKEAVEGLAASRGVSISEYLRILVLEDLDRRGLLDAAKGGEVE